MPTREELLAEAQRRGIKVPEDKNSEGISRTIGKQALIAEAKKRGLVPEDFDVEAVKPKPSVLAAIGHGILEGATLGFSNEIAARIGSLRTDRTYDEGLKKLSGETNAAYSAYPKTALLSELAGGLATGGQLAGVGLTSNIMRGASPLVRTLQAGTVGAIEGGIAGAGHAQPGHREEGAVIGGVLGGGLGAAAQPAISAVRRGVDRLRPVDRVAQDYIFGHLPPEPEPVRFSKVVGEMASRPSGGGIDVGNATRAVLETALTGGIPAGEITKFLLDKSLKFIGKSPTVPKRVINRLTSIINEETIDAVQKLPESVKVSIREGVIPDGVPPNVKEILKILMQPDTAINTLARDAGPIAYGTALPSIIGRGTESREEY